MINKLFFTDHLIFLFFHFLLLLFNILRLRLFLATCLLLIFFFRFLILIDYLIDMFHLGFRFDGLNVYRTK